MNDVKIKHQRIGIFIFICVLIVVFYVNSNREVKYKEFVVEKAWRNCELDKCYQILHIMKSRQKDQTFKLYVYDERPIKMGDTIIVSYKEPQPRDIRYRHYPSKSPAYKFERLKERYEK